jgi:hypothetical protein
MMAGNGRAWGQLGDEVLRDEIADQGGDVHPWALVAVIPRESGGPSTPQLHCSVIDALEYWVARSSRAMTSICAEPLHDYANDNARREAGHNELRRCAKPHAPLRNCSGSTGDDPLRISKWSCGEPTSPDWPDLAMIWPRLMVSPRFTSSSLAWA